MLPDFRNVAIILRIAVLAILIHVVPIALVTWSDWPEGITSLLSGYAIYEPVLLGVIFTLYLTSPILVKLPYRVGCTVVLLIAVSLTTLWTMLASSGRQDGLAELLHENLVALTVASILLWYFNWRHRVLSPALTEARLMALQARIRPHFLFNSLNTVLGLMRSEPRRAESVLENLSELFRASMAEASKLVPLARELELARSYADIEGVRLGNRLTVNWQCQNA
ncbi:MAG: histidine kinase, partial [Negativicutes bacterium]|nr:histidine kinase [Negativicutes bacterium]